MIIIGLEILIFGMTVLRIQGLRFQFSSRHPIQISNKTSDCTCVISCFHLGGSEQKPTKMPTTPPLSEARPHSSLFSLANLICVGYSCIAGIDHTVETQQVHRNTENSEEELQYITSAQCICKTAGKDEETIYSSVPSVAGRHTTNGSFLH